MNKLSKERKEKVEKYLRENESAVSVVWGEDSCTTLDANGKTIDDYMIDIDEDGEIYYTPVSDPSVTLNVA